MSPIHQTIYKKVRLKSMIIWMLSICALGKMEAASVNRPPTFDLDDQHSEIVLRLKEGPETPVGSLIYTLHGSDADNDPLTFGIRPNPYDQDILRIETVNRNTANLYLNRELDRETRDEYVIVLTLTDQRLGNGNFVTQSLLLIVEDINDNEPVFRPYQGTLEVPEDSAPGVLTTLEATDADEGAYGQVMYYLQDLDGDDGTFSISTNHGRGTIRLVQQLDYETKNIYQLRVLAVDRANQGPVNTATASLVVKVKDVEDQPPHFSAINPVVRIAEDTHIGSPVITVKAHDGDRGINNAIRYAIAPGADASFAINANTGLVYTTRQLDREDSRNQENGAYILEIVATEVSAQMPPPSASTEITIILIDINDETPTFRMDRYQAEISEAAQENTPVTFTGDSPGNGVYDFDQGKNGTFDLFLEPDDGLFEITPRRAVNEVTFLVRLRRNSVLDYESVQRLNYTIIAREMVTDSPKWSSAPLTVIVRDSNDNIPEFEKSLYEFTIPENSRTGTVVGQISASDRDSGAYGTAGLRYTHLSGSIAHLLHMDAKSGSITIRSPGDHEFDRETIGSHHLSVEARDNLGEGNRNTVPIVIRLSDVNDNAPVFAERQYEAKLLENKAHFEMPLMIRARDADQTGTPNADIVYEFAVGSSRLHRNFTIHEHSGIMSIRRPLDFEAFRTNALGSVDAPIQPIYLTVIARDLGTPSLSAQVQVVVYLHDVNDHAPQFGQPFYSTAIREDLAGGKTVAQVSAIDRDGSSPNNAIVYRIQRGAADKFVISSDTGIITVAHGSSLDPDLSSPKTTQYNLIVMALDGGLGEQQKLASTMVNITILDVNNKAPTIVEPDRITMLENTPPGTELYRVRANDLDTDAKLKYTLIAGMSEARSEEGVLVRSSEYNFVDAFHIDADTGLVKVAKLIDRERIEQLRLAVGVEDTAAIGPKQFASAFLVVLVEDENDNNPHFRKPFYTKAITENSATGTPVLNVAAFDIDKNRTIRYELNGPGEIVELLHVDEETGEIVVAQRIDHESVQWLNFTVRASDSGVPMRSTMVDVFVRIVDENDNNPYFLNGPTNISVPENSPIGTRITKVQAADADSGDFGKITFLIDKLSSHGKFTIDADTGVLSVAEQLDREDRSGYMVVVEAWDNYQFGYLSGESRNAFKQFHINILDENDSPPIIEFPSAPVQISEYHDLNEPVVHIKATDADDPLTPNGRVEFRVIGGSGQALFKILQHDHWNCVLYAKRSLHDYYGNYSIVLEARDLGKPTNVVKRDLNVIVLDFNDHAPYFVAPSKNNTIRVPENATIGTNIVQVRALDDDVGLNAAILYRFKPDSLGNYRSFSIDPKTGNITLRMSLDREKQKIYDLRIEAYDQGVPPLTTDLDLTIYVRNVNDYEPQFLVDDIVVQFVEHGQPGIERIKLPDTVDRDEVDDLDDPPSQVCYFIVYGNADGLFDLDAQTHVLSVLRELDREETANHTLVVKATENCNQTPALLNLAQLADNLDNRLSYQSAMTRSKLIDQPEPSFNRYKHSRSLRSANEPFDDSPTPTLSIEETQQDESYRLSVGRHSNEQLLLADALRDDATLVRIDVRVSDINDNAPRFGSKVFTGGLTTTTDFGSTVMHVHADDLDEGPNAVVRYYLSGDIQRTLTEGLDQLSRPAFLVDDETGAIVLNFDPQRGMKGYFDFSVLANDTAGQQDVAHVFIYLLRDDQRVKFVLRQQPAEVRERIGAFRRVLSNVTRAIVNVDDFKVHENRDGSVDKTKTDLYIHLVDQRDNSILEVDEVLQLIDQNIEVLDELFKEFNVLDTQPSEALQLQGGIAASGHVVLWLVLTNLFVSALLVVVMSMCFSQRQNYRRQLRAACVHAYTISPSDMTIRTAAVAGAVPNTNKHSMQGSNPIWLKAYANEWFKNDDDLDIGPRAAGTDTATPSLGSLSQRRAHTFDSLDENVLATGGDDPMDDVYVPTNHGPKDATIDAYNVYQQIDRLSGTARALTKKLETTEL